MKRKKDGDVFRMPLGDGTWCYGQIVTSYERFFDRRDDGSSKPEAVVQLPIAFVLSVSAGSIKDERVERIGWSELEADAVASLPNFYRYDVYKKIYQIVTPRNPVKKTVSKSECVGLRRSGVASFDNAVRHALDYFEQRVTTHSLMYGVLRADTNVELYSEDRFGGKVEWDNPDRYLIGRKES